MFTKLKNHTFTLGIEEEFAIIDPETRELRSHIQEILEGGKVMLKEQIKPEMHQSVVELGTEICQSIVDARTHVVELRSQLAWLAGRSGLKIASAGTHPFSHWHDQLITEGERYEEIVKDMQLLARANLIFGLHVHVGIPERTTAIQVMNQARYFLPHIYALSVNSPFWIGRNTGLKGYRLKVFERFPAPVFRTRLRVFRNTRIIANCWSRPAVSTTPRKSGGTFASILFSTLWKCGCVMRSHGWMTRWRSRP
jgi:carboxylate-amine ligase